MSAQAITYVATPESDEYQHVGDVCRRQEDGQQLHLDERFDLVNHSPTGFAWNYGGSGPAQLALAILADVTGDDDLAVRLHQQFKADVIANMPRGKWELPEASVREWIEVNQREFSTGAQRIDEMDKRIDDVTAEANEHLLKRT